MAYSRISDNDKSDSKYSQLGSDESNDVESTHKRMERHQRSIQSYYQRDDSRYSKTVSRGYEQVSMPHTHLKAEQKHIVYGPSNPENYEYRIIGREFSCPLFETLSCASMLPDGRVILADKTNETILVYSKAGQYYGFKFQANDIAVISSQMIACVDSSRAITLFEVGERRMCISHTFYAEFGYCYRVEWAQDDRQFIVLIKEEHKEFTIELFREDGSRQKTLAVLLATSSLIPNISYSPLSRSVYVVNSSKGISCFRKDTKTRVLTNFKSVDIQHYSDIACDGSGNVYVLTNDDIGGRELYKLKGRDFEKIVCKHTHSRIKFVNGLNLFIAWKTGRVYARVLQITQARSESEAKGGICLL